MKKVILLMVFVPGGGLRAEWGVSGVIWSFVWLLSGVLTRKLKKCTIFQKKTPKYLAVCKKLRTFAPRLRENVITTKFSELLR